MHRKLDSPIYSSRKKSNDEGCYCENKSTDLRLPLQHLFFCRFPNVIPLHYVHYNYMHSALICMMHRIWTIMQIRHD